MLRAHVIGAIAIGGVVIARTAHAEDSVPTRVQLEVEAECTDTSDFGKRLHAHSPRIEPGRGEGATAVAITIAQAPSGKRVEGTMRVGDSVRNVEGGSCEEVADALSLVTALTFDPEAGATSPSPAAKTVPPPSPPERPVPAPSSPLRPAPAPEGWRFGLGMHGVGALVDEVPIGASVVGEMARGRELSTLTFRLALTMYSASVELGPRSANLVWTFLVPQVCPLRLRAGVVSVYPCAAVGMGVLSSEPTRGVSRSNGFTRAWIAPRGLVRARIAVAGSLGVELEAALDVPLTRDRYAFQAVEAYRVPAVMPVIGAGITMQLP